MTNLPFRRWVVAGFVGVALVVAATGPARADRGETIKYVGIHPIAAGGFCYIEAPHVHIYQPHKDKQKVKLLYRVHDGHYEFVGDPVGHGYDGPTHSYYGHHPIAVDVVAGAPVHGGPHHVEFCYLDGPHHHGYQPSAELQFTVKGGAYWFVGAYPPEYQRDRKVLVRINALYRPLEYQRPVIEVEPPVEYVGPIFEVQVPVVEVAAPAVEVHGEVRAGLEVHLPAPSLEVSVGIGLPGVVIVDDHHHHRGRKTGWHKPGKTKFKSKRGKR